ncbi:YhcH/YjgK/YiaL family protein [uncultured Helicobacter sp.]|uniref:YhcH/YjgK/YiaL family protein n=1 Tax=uncultured Helicobacter sp. TaxID=175537 RepID=UPI00374EAA8F
MAIIGHLEQFGAFFAHYPALRKVREYLAQALTPDSIIHQRIVALRGNAACESQDSHTQDLRERDSRVGDSCARDSRVEVSYDLGGGIRAIEQTYALKPHTEAFYESHRAFVDFQLCVAGAEYFEVGHIADFTPLTSYDESKDLITYRKGAIVPHQLYFYSGILGVFFPEDVHAGGLGSQELPQPQKVVLKVPIEIFL